MEKVKDRREETMEKRIAGTESKEERQKVKGMKAEEDAAYVICFRPGHGLRVIGTEELEEIWESFSGPIGVFSDENYPFLILGDAQEAYSESGRRETFFLGKCIVIADDHSTSSMKSFSPEDICELSNYLMRNTYYCRNFGHVQYALKVSDADVYSKKTCERQ